VKRRLSKTSVTFLGGVEGAAKAMGTTPRMIRRWMRLGLSEDGQDRLRSAMSVLISSALFKKRERIAFQNRECTNAAP